MQDLKANSPEVQQTFFQFYACSLVIIRFLEGISWGYSQMLVHDSLETKLNHTIQVVYNIILRIKQIYREDKEFGQEASKYGDTPAVYCPEPVF